MLVKQGIHPAHTRQTERLAQLAGAANTFEGIAREWIEKKKLGWSPNYTRQVESFLGDDVFKSVGHLPIRSVTAAHLLQILNRIEGRGAETVALLVRQWCSAIFRYAVATLRADSDPAAALKGAISRPKIAHSKPLTREQIRHFIQALDHYGAYRATVIALRLILLTFVRTVELRAAEWPEIDFDRAEWWIPASRMKMRETHTVPLSRQALRLLRELYTLTGGQRWLFPNYRQPTTCMTATTLNRALERMGLAGKDGIGFAAHGFRATAPTLLNESGYRPDVIERQLAHRERNKVRASYNQAEYLEEYLAADGAAPFTEWLGKLRGGMARVRIAKRLTRLRAGLMGDWRAVGGGGVIELREDYGPGNRVYCAHHGATLIVLLAGGDKRTQQKDIERAQGYWQDWKQRKAP